MRKVWIELLCSMATPTRSWDKGEVVEWETADADHMIERGVARKASKAQIETAQSR